MLYTILPEEMKRVERRVMDATGTPSLILMERAATHVADAALPFLRNGGKLLVLCGTGNNGGDGLAAMRLLLQRMVSLHAVVWKLGGVQTEETVTQWARLSPYMTRITVLPLENDVPDIPEDITCAIDALFGTGLNRPLTGAARSAVEKINASGVPVIAVDIPSGLSGNTGYAIGEEQNGLAVHAEVTVTFHRPKTGLFLGDGLDCCGRIIVGEIGIPARWDDAVGMAVLNRDDRLLPTRKRNTHKGMYGRVLVLAGSYGMAGAAGICAMAALRTGAGLVTVACPRQVVPTVQAICPCATCLPLPEEDVTAAWALLAPALERADALVAGCGMGMGELAAGLLSRLIPWLLSHSLPAVLDADALNLLAETEGKFAAESSGENPQGIREPKTEPTASPCLHLPDTVVLTPHVGEAARLLSQKPADIQRNQPEAARAIHNRYGGSVVLKSASSVLLSSDGEAINLYGTAAMAKGGSGDALAGVLGALLAGRSAYELVGVRLLQTACALHGLAGITAVEAKGERGMLATDLCEALGRVPDVIERSIATEAPHAQRLVTTYDLETLSMHETSEETEALSRSNGIQTISGQEVQPINPHAVLGKTVRVTVDRPLGSRHPERREIVYGLNYGYVANVLAADNEWQDAYVLGVLEPVEVFEGEVVAVIHRLNDVEDKWVVAAPGTRVTEGEVRARTAFVEKFFRSEVWLL